MGKKKLLDIFDYLEDEIVRVWACDTKLSPLPPIRSQARLGVLEAIASEEARLKDIPKKMRNYRNKTADLMRSIVKKYHTISLIRLLPPELLAHIFKFHDNIWPTISRSMGQFNLYHGSL